jgi:ribosomal protein L10
LRSLRKELKKNNFLIKNVKTRLAKICLKNIFLKNLMHGPLFIIYNNSFTEKNMKYLQTFNKYNFILGIMFFNKFYLTSKIKQFKNFNSAFQFFISILETIYIFLFYNFNFLNKIYLK